MSTRSQQAINHSFVSIPCGKVQGGVAELICSIDVASIREQNIDAAIATFVHSIAEWCVSVGVSNVDVGTHPRQVLDGFWLAAQSCRQQPLPYDVQSGRRDGGLGCKHSIGSRAKCALRGKRKQRLWLTLGAAIFAQRVDGAVP